MAGSVNKVILVGNLGKDPEIRHSQDGGKIVSFSLATSEQWKDRNSGERKEKTEWHRVVVFNDRIADVVEKYVKKGAKLYIEGQLQTRKWTGQDGNERYTTEIVIGKFKGELTMLDSRGGGAPSGGGYADDPGPSAGPDDMGGGYSSGSSGGGAKRGGGGGDLNDEIPF